MIDLGGLQIVTAAVVLVLLWTLETVIPFLPNSQERFKHDVRNLVIGLFNSIILAALFAPIFFFVTSWTQAKSFGLLNLVNLPVWFSTILAILLQDSWLYFWHRINHRIPFLWRFHKVHHSDSTMNASTAIRFHTGEILISAVLRLGVIAFLGLSLWQVLLYDLLIIPFIFLHHSNVQFPGKLDKIYQVLFVSPAMHRIHHSPERIETDSNYGAIFSFWDKLGHSLRLRENAIEVKFGLSEFKNKETESLPVLAMMPFQHSVNSVNTYKNVSSG